MDWFKLKAFAGDNLNMNEKFQFALGRVENIVGKEKHFPSQALVFMCLTCTNLLKTLGKGEIARSEQFLLFPLCFQSFMRTFCHFIKFTLSSAESFSLEEPKISRLEKG